MSDLEKNHPSNDDAQELDEAQLESVSGGDILRGDLQDDPGCKPIPEQPDTIFGVGV